LRALALATLIGGVAAGPARAQGTPEQRSVLLLLDASKSMNEDAGNGESRLDAAKAAVGDLVKVLPDDVQVGMRVYGARVAESGRREGCRDTELAVPVGPLDRGALTARVNALQGRGRTPIGRSLRAAADDLPAGGKRTVVLVSDGGDNCAPPDPCRVAGEVAKRGVNLNISVVGLQVNERVRRQLRCIADAGGGAYVDAGDADALRDELLAAIARAFRDYKPVGTPVQGGPTREQATPVGTGQYLDAIQPGQERWYAISVKAGQRLLAAATAIPRRASRGIGEFHIQLYGPDGRSLDGAMAQVINPTAFLPTGGPKTLGVHTPPVGGSSLRPGVYRVGVSLKLEGETAAWPLELGFEALDQGREPSFVRQPGPLSAALGAQKPPGASAGGGQPRQRPRPRAAQDEEQSASAAALAGAGVVGLVAGLLGGRLAFRRRRR
jgi:Ca-activated chloride channel family protein